MQIHKIGDYMEMQGGIFRLVTPTLREGQEYPLSDINPNLSQNPNELPQFWQHISLSYDLSQITSQFSTSTITNIGSKIQAKIDKVKQLFSEIENDIQGDLDVSFEPVKNPYKPQITGIKIDGYKDGEIFGTIGLDRALPVNEADLSRNRTVPFAVQPQRMEIGEVTTVLLSQDQHEESDPVEIYEAETQPVVEY